MDALLTRYVRALRQAGAQVSPAETLDAASAVSLVGYASRERLRLALGVTLAKTPEDKALHENMFDRFFTAGEDSAQDAAAEADAPQPETDPQGGEDAARRADEAGPAAASGAREGQAAHASSPGQDSAEAFLRLARSSDLDLAIRQAAAAAGVDDIRFSSQSGYFIRRILERLGVRELEERLMAAMQQDTAEAQAMAAAMMAARARVFERARDLVEQRFDVFGRGATEAFMDDVVVNRSLAELSGRDLDRMRAIVARMARRLAIRHGRRRRRRLGQIDVRRTVRMSLRNEAIPFELFWKQSRREKPKIVAICDVSGSVARYVRFLLLLLYALHEGIADLRAFAFSSRLHDVEPILRSLPFDAAMSRIIRVAGGGSTDYGQAFVDLERGHPDIIDRRTSVLILGDGRSNQTDPQLALFSGLADRARRVVWLTPEPEGMWGSGDSILPLYRPFCAHMAYCRTASDIERAVDEMLSAYA
jgi:uncharacterized protein with von Willebrand factor type A (vWA) domain